jgi:alkylation response protein AidB-like acyl-CoA dehydrogenase
MYLEETAEQQSLRKELRAYFEDLLTPEARGRLSGPGEGGPEYRRIVRQMGSDGWLGVGWPKEFGGQGRSAVEQYIFFDEVQRAEAPFPFVTINTVGPALMTFGTDDQKDRFLKRILAGEIHFAIGYTEPEAGTDLASLRTRAVRDGDEYVINGNKVFTSGANDADFIWLACRTDPDAPKHKGISMIITPTDQPGFSWTPIITVGGNQTTATYYDNARAPVANLVGAENEGWRLITTQLNHERVGLGAMAGLTKRLYEQSVDWARATDSGQGGKVIDLPWVQSDLARCHAKLETMRLLNFRMAASIAADKLSPAESSAVKVFGTEGLIEIYRLLLGIIGPAAHLRPGSSGAILNGRVEQAARMCQINTFGGGVNDVQREIVAAVGLKMARQAR